MGFLRRLTGRGVTPDPSAPQTPEPAPPTAPGKPGDGHLSIQVIASHRVDLNQPFPVSGTTTAAKESVAELARRYRLGGSGHLECRGQLQRSGNREGDFEVTVDGLCIGWIPSHSQETLAGLADPTHPVHVQLFTEIVNAELRGEAWAWLASTPPRWNWSADNRPPMTSTAKAHAHQQAVDKMVTDALASGATKGASPADRKRAAQFRAGIVGGTHYLQLVEPIKQAKREGRLDDALALCYQAIAGAEGDRGGREPAPFYTEQAAIIHRKLGQRGAEAAVLGRWLAFVPEQARDATKLGERLRKLG